MCIFVPAIEIPRNADRYLLRLSMSYDTSCTHIERGRGPEAEKTRVGSGTRMHVCIISPYAGGRRSTRSGECHGSLHVSRRTLYVLVHTCAWHLKSRVLCIRTLQSLSTVGNYPQTSTRLCIIAAPIRQVTSRLLRPTRRYRTRPSKFSLSSLEDNRQHALGSFPV